MSYGVIFQEPIDEPLLKKKFHPTIQHEIIEYLLYFLRVFLTVSIVYLFIRSSVFDVVSVSGNSMLPSYSNGDTVYVNLISSKISDYRRGEVVILRAPGPCSNKKDLYIKRIIGLPGERVGFENGKVYIYNDSFPKGTVLDEGDYLASDIPTNKLGAQSNSRIVEPQLASNEYYVLGDNRNNSSDSRSCGPVTKEAIIGKGFFRSLPPSKAGLFVEPRYNI